MTPANATDLQQFMMAHRAALMPALDEKYADELTSNLKQQAFFNCLGLIDGKLVGSRFYLLYHQNILIGFCTIKPGLSDNELEIGGALIPEYRQRGFAKEAMQALITVVKNTGWATKILFRTKSWNEPVHRLGARFGFKKWKSISLLTWLLTGDSIYYLDLDQDYACDEVRWSTDHALLNGLRINK